MLSVDFFRDATIHFLEGSPCFWCLVMYLYSWLIEGTVLIWKSFSNPPILPSDIELPFQQLPNLAPLILWSNKELQIKCWNSKKVEKIFSLICLMVYLIYLWKFRKTIRSCKIKKDFDSSLPSKLHILI